MFGNSPAAKRLDVNKAGTPANSYAMGNRVYNGTSNSPHAGPGSVNPAGYMDRDRRAAVKRKLLVQQSRGRL